LAWNSFYSLYKQDVNSLIDVGAKYGQNSSLLKRLLTGTPNLPQTTADEKAIFKATHEAILSFNVRPLLLADV